MNFRSAFALAALFIPLWSSISPAQAIEPCTIQSEQMPKAKIRFYLPNRVGAPIGVWRGEFMLANKKIYSLTASKMMGYGTIIWSLANSKGRSDYLIPFFGHRPTKSLSGVHKADRFLLVGLGPTLYYGDYRDNLPLIAAAEGFWRVHSGCQGFMRLNDQ